MSERLKACARALVDHAKAKVAVVGVETSDEDGLRTVIDSVTAALSQAKDRNTGQPLPTKAAYWSCAGGWEPGGRRLRNSAGEVYTEPAAIEGGELELELALANAATTNTRAVLVFFDVWPYITTDAGASALQIAGPIRRLREMVRQLKAVPPTAARLIVLVSRRLRLPDDIRDEVPVLKLGLPTLEDHLEALRSALIQQGLPELEPIPARVAAEAGLGLSSMAFGNAIATSLVTTKGKIDVALINAAKRSALEGSALRWIDVPKLSGVDDGVAGLENVKAHISRRIKAWTPEARAAGLEQPKGLLLTGVQGCGKTALAVAVAGWLGIPLVEWSFASMQSKYLGETEQKFATGKDTVDVLGRVVVLCDEFEKAVGGSGESDGGTNTRVMGELLTWMQKKQSQAYIIATSNKIEKLPDELTRKGRFDEVFFVDLPTARERKQIFQLHLGRRGLPANGIVTDELVRAAEKFSGAEIEAVVVDARFAAFDTGQPLSTAMLLEEISNTVPLAVRSADRIKALREKGSAIRPASKPEVTAAASSQFGALEM